MFDWLDKANLRTHVSQGYGLSRDNPEQTVAPERRYDACITLPAHVSEAEAVGLSFCTLPGGTYARYRHTGDHKHIGALFREIRSQYGPTSSLQLDPLRPFVAIYLDDPACNPVEKLRTDLCVPVSPVPAMAENNDNH